MKKKKETPYHYYVIKLEHPPNKCLSKYLCVRRSWTHKADEDTRDPDTLSKGDYGRVQAWYPFEMTSKRVKSHAKPDLNEGAMYMARIKYKTDLYKDAKSWIFLMQKSEKNKQNNEQNEPLNEWTAETNAAAGDQSTNEEELTSTSENCDKQDKLAEIPNSPDLVIIEDSKDHEPVTSSSSPHITQSDLDTQKNDDIINCLLDRIQSLLKEVKRERNEQLRIEFDGMRIVRICDNNLLDRLARITVNVDNISYEVHATEDLVPEEHREAEVVTGRTKTPEASDAPASTSSPMASVPQASPIDQSFNSMQAAATRLEHVAPSGGRTTHTELPSDHAEPHELPANAPRYIASSSQNYSSDASSNVRLRQNSPAPMAIDSPYVIVEPSHPMSYHLSPQISVLPAVISSTNCISKPQNVCPTVTVRSPDEINNRAMSQNSNPNSFGSATNRRTYQQHSSLPIVYSNVTSDDRVSSEFPSSQAWVTSTAVSAMNNIRPTPQVVYRSDNINNRVASQNYSNVPLQLPNRLNNRRCSHHTSAVITSVAMTNVRPQDSHSMVDSFYRPDEINQRVTCQNSSNDTQQCADRLNSRRYSHQTSATPAVITSMGMSNVRPQDSHPHMESLYSPDEINNRVSSQNSSNVTHQVANHLNRRRHSHIASATLAVITSMPMNNVRPQDTQPIPDSVYNPEEINNRVTTQNSSNVTLQIANHLNSRRYSHQTSTTPAVITSMGMTNARPTQQNPIMDSVYSPDERNTRVTSQNVPNVTLLRGSRLNNTRYSHQTSIAPVVISSVATSRSKPQSSRPKVGNVSPEVTIIPRYFNSPVGSDSDAPLRQNSSTRRVDLELNDVYTAQESSIPNLAAFASYNDYFVRSLTQNQFNTDCSRIYDSPSGSRPAHQTGSRKRVHFSMTREPFPQNGHIPVKKSLSLRHSILQKERSESGVVILDE